MSDLECEHCGEPANSLVGGEHILTCSEVVGKGELRELVERMRGVGVKHIDAHRNQEKWANELEALIDDG